MKEIELTIIFIRDYIYVDSERVDEEERNRYDAVFYFSFQFIKVVYSEY
jgi:hypothetical protein